MNEELKEEESLVTIKEIEEYLKIRAKQINQSERLYLELYEVIDLFQRRFQQKIKEAKIDDGKLLDEIYWESGLMQYLSKCNEELQDKIIKSFEGRHQ